MQDDRDAFIIDAEVHTQIANELGAREVDVGEHQLRFGLRRNEPAGRDPGFERAMLEAGADQKFLNRDHSNLQMLAGGFGLAPLPPPRRILPLPVAPAPPDKLLGDVFFAPDLFASRGAPGLLAGDPSPMS